MSSWPRTRLRYVADLNPPVRADLLAAPETELSFLPMEAIGEDGSLSLERTRPVAEVRNGYSYFEDGDVAFAKVTPCFENGKGALMRGLDGGAGFGTTEITVLRPKSGTVARYLSYVVQSDTFRQLGVAAMTGAGGLKRVPDDFTRDFPTVWPDSSEQERIANFLDDKTARIDALIAAKEELCNALDEMRRVAISTSVTHGIAPDAEVKKSDVAWIGTVPAHWGVKRLKYLLAPNGLVRGPFGGDLKKEIFVEQGFKVYEQKNAIYESHRLGESFISPKKYLEMSRFQVQPGDFLMSCSGTIGRVYRVPSDAPAGIINQALLIIRFNELVLPEFAQWLFLAEFFTTQILDNSQGGAMKNLVGMDVFTSISLPVPPKAEQRKIAEHLRSKMTQIDELKSHAVAHIARLREYRSSLISAAVTGQLDVGSFKEPV